MNKIKTECFVLPPLPYAKNALGPYISTAAVELHYGKHHQGYVDKLNELVSESDFAGLELPELIVKTSGKAEQTALFNNAAQVWNHTFYWNSLAPGGTKKPNGKFGRRIESSFGDYDIFMKKFAQAGMDQFGSGWVWLVKEDDLLKIIKTSNAENPLSERRGTALLCMDVWEHAYYPDYQNRRNDYLAAVLDKLINWNFASENFSKA